jgi:diaminohydroxyphosphoribosylaminopyrimidine deaminase / 5-amino-6-(5-phosphoribosylamino)uracil reductase
VTTKQTSLFSPFEKRVMRTLLRLAKTGTHPWPNPCTAAAIIQNDTVVGIGKHQQAGEAHAEVAAIAAAGDKANGATLMVNLEPCTHWGRTPPCVDAIVRAGIREVIYAVSDPNPKVRASSATQYLMSQGIQVRSGLLETDAFLDNAAFMKQMIAKTPFITAKIATSLDGKIALANGESKYITGTKSRQYVHQLRANHDVIVVGIGTILADDPMLTVRDIPTAKQPAIVILDAHGRTPLQSRIFEERDPSQVLILVGAEADTDTLSQKATIIQGLQTPFSWPHIIDLCAQQDWTRVLIEGGEQVFTSALDAQVVDKVIWCMAPLLLGGKNSFVGYGGNGVSRIADAKQLAHPKVRRMGPDILIEGFLNNPLNWIKEPS